MKFKIIFLLIVLSSFSWAANFSWTFSYGIFRAEQVNRNSVVVDSDFSELSITVHRAPNWTQQKFHEEVEQVVVGLDAYYD